MLLIAKIALDQDSQSGVVLYTKQSEALCRRLCRLDKIRFFLLDRKKKTYGTVDSAIALIATLLDVALESTRVKRLEQFEAAQKIRGDRHDSSPVVKFAAVLGSC